MLFEHSAVRADLDECPARDVRTRSPKEFARRFGAGGYGELQVQRLGAGEFGSSRVAEFHGIQSHRGDLGPEIGLAT